MSGYGSSPKHIPNKENTQMPKTTKQPKIISDVVIGQHLQLSAIRVARVLAAVYAAGAVTRMYWQKLNLSQYFTYQSPTI
jgi:hypothetical protein